MNVPRYAVATARVLKRHIERAAATYGDRARGLETIERAMRVRVRRRRLQWGAGLLALATTGLLFWSGASPGERRSTQGAAGGIAVSPWGSGTKLRSDGRETALLAKATVTPGATLLTAADGGAALQLATRSSLQLSGDTELRVEGDETTSRFALRRGALSAHVAKLTEGRRFIVVTPDAEVEVRGTRFALRVLGQPQACGSGSLTRLEVSEGVVEVRASGTASRVRAGQSWPADCGSVGQPAREQPSESPAPADSASAVATSVARSGRAVAPATAEQSGLSRQNDLFASGVALRRQGNAAGALRAFQELITHFPSSPLAENAMVERMRLLSSTQRVQAKQEAHRYLRRYPRGFAVDEAQRLVDEP